MNRKKQYGTVSQMPRRRPNPSERKQAEDVMYIQPKPFLKRRFFLHLATVLAVVLALILGMSIFFKVQTVTISGVQKYTAWDVRQAAGIANGENLMALSKAKISGNILAKLPYVSSVRVGIKLPGTVHIEITEMAVTYAVEDTQGTWWRISSDGRVAESVSTAEAQDYTRILGIRIETPQPAQQAIAQEPVPETDAQGETIPITVLGAERLTAALNVLRELEKNGILGKAASVDVTNMGGIILWYGTQYKVLLGGIENMAYKIQSMCTAIEDLGSYNEGILDVRFTISEDEVVHMPFDKE